MKVIVIASGSKGNCTYVEDNGQAILIDAGISYKRVREAIDGYQLSGIPMGILITHEHNDHINSLRIIANKLHIPVYLTEKTYQALPSNQRDIDEMFIEPNLPLEIGTFKITPIRIFHDARDPVGFIINSGNEKLVFITDTGYVHSSVMEKIKNADAYILESNHDPDVLMNSDRTFELKRRILGDRGHLCNEDSAYLLTSVIGEKTKVIVHAHISMECNYEDIVVNTMKDIFSENGLEYNKYITHCASQTVPFYFEVNDSNEN